MKFIDMHCDTLMLAFKQGKKDIFDMPGAMLDIKRMKQADAMAQFFAIFMPPPGAGSMMDLPSPVEDEAYIDFCLETFNTTITNHSDFIAPAYNGKHLLDNSKKGLMSGLVTFEDGRAIDNSLDKLKGYYDRGIRLISLLWNHENCLGYPNSLDPQIMNQGLKDFGKQAIEYMNELGIIIDVSHLSDGGFMDVAEISKKPFVASHSNCRSLSPHQRNLTDEMVKILANKGGVAGINFAPAFLNSDIINKDSTIELMSVHIHKLIDLGGVECVGLGSDFDGITGNFELTGVEKMPLLLDKLRKDGLSEGTIEKIAYKNVQRIICDVL